MSRHVSSAEKLVLLRKMPDYPLDILRSPEGFPLRVVGDVLICEGTGRAYSTEFGSLQLFDEEDVSPFLRKDYEVFRRSANATLDKKAKRNQAHYNAVRKLNTEFMFCSLTYMGTEQRRVCELGAGDCSLISRFADMGFDAYAVDFFPWEAQRALAERAARGARAITSISAPMSRLPFASQSLDIVYMHAAIHHALPCRHDDFEWCNPRNMHDCLREIGRVLKRDGAFFLLGEGVYPDDIVDRHHERTCQETGAVYESHYKIKEYESAFCETGVFPTLWVDKPKGGARVFAYKDTARIDLVTRRDRIKPRDYQTVIPTSAKRADLSTLLPAWITPKMSVPLSNHLSRMLRAWQRLLP